MHVVAIVQARLSSQRLPGKVLRPLHGRPMIDHLIDALRRSRTVDGVMIATSDHASDNALEEYANSVSVPCYRGSLTDVATRMLRASMNAGAEALVRVNGDSPLLDPALVDRAVRLFRAEPLDLVTNVLPRSFPKGQSVEVIANEALDRVVSNFSDAEREHVTSYFYAHPEEFRIRGFQADQPRTDLQLSVDSAQDFARCEAILRLLGRPAWAAGWEMCVTAADSIASQTARGVSA